MKVIIILFTLWTSLFISNVKNIIYIANDGANESIEEVLSRCKQIEEYGLNNIEVIDTNYNSNTKIGEYYININGDRNGYIIPLNIKVIVIPNKEYEITLYSNNILTINEILNNIGVNGHYTIVNDNYKENKNPGTYYFEFLYQDMKDYIIRVNINIVNGILSKDNTIIYPLYNRLDEDKLNRLVSITLNINKEDIFSVKGEYNIYYEGIYKLNVMDINNNIYNINLIIKEMLPKREVTLLEKLYIYIPIFFNIDNRYKTNEFFDIKTRIKYISNIYESNLIRV